MTSLSNSNLRDQGSPMKQQLRVKHMNMLSFLYNAEFKIASEQFDQKIAPYSQLKRQKLTEKIEADHTKRLFNAISERLHEKIVREDMEAARALSKLQTLWQTRKVQYFHRYYFETFVFSTYLQHIPTLIRNQDALIRNEQHIYFTILRAIWARDICLGQIRNRLKEMGPEDMYEHFHTVRERLVDRDRKLQQRQYRVHGYRAKYRLDEREGNLGQTKIEALFLQISNYRKLTVHVMDLIVKWRSYIQSLTHDPKKRKEPIEYYYMSNNYLLSILNDSNFIAASFLSNFYTFAVRNDPFLFRPILAMEEKEGERRELVFDECQLKELIACPQAQLNKIMAAVEQLYRQLQSNLRNSKFLNKKAVSLTKSVSLSLQSKIQLKSQISKNFSIKLMKTNLQSHKSQKQQLPKLQRQNSLALTRNNSLVRRHSFKKKVSFNDANILSMKNSNPQLKSPFQYLNSDQLKYLKEEVVRKLQFDMNLQAKTTLMNSEEFGGLVDDKVRREMKEMLVRQEREQLDAQIRVTALSFPQEEIGSFLTSLYKTIPAQYHQLQSNQQELTVLINEIEYCYILRLHTKQQEVAHVIATINRLIKQYKSVEVQLIAFRNVEQLQRVMLRTVEFMWKYENVKEIVFKLTPASSLNQIVVRSLQARMANSCKTTEKRYKYRVQARFIFANVETKEKAAYNPYPYQFHFKLYSLFSDQHLALQGNGQENSQKQVHYDYMIMEILRRYISSEHFIVLRDAFPSKDRFRIMLAQLMAAEDESEQQVKLTALSASNITELNNQLHKTNTPLLQVNDVTKINSLHMLQLEYTFTISHQLRVISDWNGQKWHRYTIANNVDHFVDHDGTEFYKLPVQENHHLHILLFKPTHYLENQKSGFNLYLSQKIEKYHDKWSKKQLKHLWIEMLRCPQDLTQKYEHYLPSYRCKEFGSIQKELIMGDMLDWFTDIQIQNGLQYSYSKEDVQLTRPLGVGVFSNKGWILYSRIIF